ncbi:hypothetical protein HY483_02090 [Candidatus Woesearchaeota archaeon]|nr:hypothetical protein [Candidatus Woesearchaeota archaeon]
MWDKYSAMALVIGLGISSPACTENGGKIRPKNSESGENSELEILFQEFQEAHNITGVEGLDARARAYRHFGDYYAEQGRYDDAKNSYVQSIKIGGENSDAYAGLARIEYLKGDKTYSKQLCKKALEIDEENDAALELLQKIKNGNRR